MHGRSRRRKVKDRRDRQLERHLDKDWRCFLQRRDDLGVKDTTRARTGGVAHSGRGRGHGGREVRRCQFHVKGDARNGDAEDELDSANRLDEVHLDYSS